MTETNTNMPPIPVPPVLPVFSGAYACFDFAAARATVRADMRKVAQLRALACDSGLLTRADGSARVHMDTAGGGGGAGTDVLVSVTGPVQLTSARREMIDRARVEVVWRHAKGRDGGPAGGSLSAGPEAKDRAELLRRTLEHVILAREHPRTVIRVVVQVVRDDGSVLAAAVNAACAALVDAGVPLRARVAACACAVVQRATAGAGAGAGAGADAGSSNGGAAADGGGRDWGVWLDPTAAEERDARTTAVLTLAFHSTGARDAVATSLVERGRLAGGQEQFFAAADLARSGCDVVFAFQRQALEARFAPPPAAPAAPSPAAATAPKK